MATVVSQTLASHAKVPIPKLERYLGDKAGRVKKRRISLACQRCRARRVRCDGALPQCQNCRNCAGQCVYPQCRKNNLKTLTELNQSMATLLNKLRDFVTEEKKQEIDNLLDRAASEISNPASPRRSSAPEEDGSGSGGGGIATTAGSDKPLGVTDAWLLRDENGGITRFSEDGYEQQCPPNPTARSQQLCHIGDSYSQCIRAPVQTNWDHTAIMESGETLLSCDLGLF